jgi:putative phage-type endonuclease
VEQRSSEWFAIRKGKMTASKAYVIATGGVGLETYILELMAEYYSNAEQEQLTNKDIERGIELEPQARTAFEFKTGLTVQEIGFVEYNEYVGCSPDGLIGSDGLVEFKAPNDKNYLKLLMNEKIKPEYIAQMQMQMYVTKRDYCYFCSYNPNFEKSLWIKKIDKDLEFFDKLEKGFKKGITMIKEIKEKIENGKTKI